MILDVLKCQDSYPEETPTRLPALHLVLALAVVVAVGTEGVRTPVVVPTAVQEAARSIQGPSQTEWSAIDANNTATTPMSACFRGLRVSD